MHLCIRSLAPAPGRRCWASRETTADTSSLVLLLSASVVRARHKHLARWCGVPRAARHSDGEVEEAQAMTVKSEKMSKYAIKGR